MGEGLIRTLGSLATLSAARESSPAGTVLILRRLGAAQTLDGRAAFFRFDPPLARGAGRPRRAPRNRRRRSLANKLDQALARVGAVALLGAVALRGDDQHALAGEALAGKPLEPRADVIRQRRRLAHVETQLYCA